TEAEKSRPLSQAPFGLIGLETSVVLTFTRLVHTGKLSVLDTIAKMTHQPANIMNLPHGKLEIGGPADITVIDPNLEWVVDSKKFASKSKYTPFESMILKGSAVLWMVDGRIVYRVGRSE